jgi:peptidoglycan/LPS O-acetylase OafA/YrhL
MKYFYNLFAEHVNNNRVYGYDILRAYAIVVVIFSHARYIVVPYIYIKEYEFFCVDGVTIFFVLSGFLIGGILIKILNNTKFDTKELSTFLIRRWFRTVPLYFLILSLVIILSYKLGISISFERYLYFIFSQNFISGHPYDFFPEAWSLSVEEWFYLLISFSLFVLLSFFKDIKKVLFYVIFSIIVMVTIYRAYQAYKYNCADVLCWGSYVRNIVVTRLDSIMYGFFGAFINFYYKDIWNKNKILLFVIGCVFIIVPQLWDYVVGGMLFKNYFSFTVTSLGTLFLLPYLSSIKSGSGMIFKIVTLISLISYSMYLINYTLIQHIFFHLVSRVIPAFSDQGILMSWVKYFIFWFMTIGVSIFLFFFFEVPVTKLRNKVNFRQNQIKVK